MIWHYRLWNFKSRDTKLERFLYTNQLPKFLNFENWTNSEAQLFAKIRVFLKLIISFFHYFLCQNRDQWHKLSGKNTHLFFFYIWFKIKRV